MTLLSPWVGNHASGPACYPTLSTAVISLLPKGSLSRDFEACVVAYLNLAVQAEPVPLPIFAVHHSPTRSCFAVAHFGDCFGLSCNTHAGAKHLGKFAAICPLQGLPVPNTMNRVLIVAVQCRVPVQ